MQSGMKYLLCRKHAFLKCFCLSKLNMSYTALNSVKDKTDVNYFTEQHPKL